MVNTEEAIHMYNAGVPLRRIGDYFGVSRQRISQVLRKNFHGTIPVKQRVRQLSKVSLNKGEEYVMNKLQSMNLSVIPQPYNSPFDLLVEGLSIEVKHRRTKSIQIHYGKKYYSYAFHGCLGRNRVDFYVFICGDLQNPSCHVVPSDRIKNNYSIPELRTYWSSRVDYVEAWHLIVDAAINRKTAVLT